MLSSRSKFVMANKFTAQKKSGMATKVEEPRDIRAFVMMNLVWDLTSERIMREMIVEMGCVMSSSSSPKFWRELLLVFSSDILFNQESLEFLAHKLPSTVALDALGCESSFRDCELQDVFEI
eukprot:1755124-Rhodomonas_salina.1